MRKYDLIAEWYASERVDQTGMFAEITRKRIRRGTFRSVRELTKAIHEYIRIYNSQPRPFQWVASASRIIRKVNRYRRACESI